jgi:UDP-N-acetylglucosamine 4-epimerase
MGHPVYINGDGETSRDFCFIQNVVQANLLAATSTNPLALNQIFNIALGDRTTLNQLLQAIEKELLALKSIPAVQAIYRDFRAGDVRHSLADITKAERLLGYQPSHRLQDGLAETMHWYIKSHD